MTSFLIYILKVNFLLAIVFLFYKLFLQKESFFTAKRTYFLIGLTGSFLLPLITYTAVKIIDIQATDHDLSLVSQPISSEGLLVINWIELGYISSAIVALLFFFYKIDRLVRYIKGLSKYKDYAQVYVDGSSDKAYSFINKIVIPANIESTELEEMVLAHEKVHVVQRHSLDVLLIGIVKHIFWFNPIVYLLQKEMQLNLEYIVDDSIAHKTDLYRYQLSLVSFAATQSTSSSLVNAFGNSELKKRIIMLNQPKSTHMKRLKFLVLTPLIGGFFYLFQVEVKAQYNMAPSEIESTQNMASITNEQEPKKGKTTTSAENAKATFVTNEEVIVLTDKRAVNRKKLQTELDEQQAELEANQMLLEAQQAELEARQVLVDQQRAELEANMNAKLEANRTNSDKQRAAAQSKLVVLKESKQAELETQREAIERKRKTVADANKKALEEKNLNKEYSVKTYEVLSLSKPQYFVDGKIVDNAELDKIAPTTIKAVNVLNKEQGMAKYGEVAKYGAIEVSLK